MKKTNHFTLKTEQGTITDFYSVIRKEGHS